MRLTNGGVELTCRTQILAHERITHRFVPLWSIAEVCLEQGGPRLGWSVGLASLVLGTFVGTGFIGLAWRAAGGAPLLAAVGLALILAALAADYVSERGQLRRGPAPNRLVLTQIKGRGWVLRGVDSLVASQFLDELQKAVASQTAPSAPMVHSVPQPEA